MPREPPAGGVQKRLKEVAEIYGLWRTTWSLKPTLVGGFNHLEKYEFVNGKDDIPYMKWKKKMFETTNQQPA